jgi:hypothetical protein
MTEKEKTEKWQKIAFSLKEEKKAFLDKPFEKSIVPNVIPTRKSKSSQIQKNS